MTRPICLTAIITVNAAVLSLRVVVRDTSPNNAPPAPAPIPRQHPFYNLFSLYGAIFWF